MKITLTSEEAKLVLCEAIKSKYNAAFREAFDLGYNDYFDVSMTNDFLTSDDIEFSPINISIAEKK